MISAIFTGLLNVGQVRLLMKLKIVDYNSKRNIGGKQSALFVKQKRLKNEKILLDVGPAMFCLWQVYAKISYLDIKRRSYSFDSDYSEDKNIQTLKEAIRLKVFKYIAYKKDQIIPKLIKKPEIKKFLNANRVRIKSIFNYEHFEVLEIMRF